MIDLPEFQRGVDFTILQYQADLIMRNNNMNEAAAGLLKLQGAMEFVQTLRNLGEPAQPMPRKLAIPQLDHSAS